MSFEIADGVSRFGVARRRERLRRRVLSRRGSKRKRRFAPRVAPLKVERFRRTLRLRRRASVERDSLRKRRCGRAPRRSKSNASAERSACTVALPSNGIHCASDVAVARRAATSRRRR
ncbi:MAG: hypothetical protein IJO40_04795 [Thermoguttaceae bacterium]|nr:hypothetical protein [Thermoguttaceae bacterium]